MIKKTLFFLTLTGISFISASPHMVSTPQILSCELSSHDGELSFSNSAHFNIVPRHASLSHLEGGNLKYYAGLVLSCQVKFSFAGAYSGLDHGSFVTTLSIPVGASVSFPGKMPLIKIINSEPFLPTSAELIFDGSK